MGLRRPRRRRDVVDPGPSGDRPRPRLPSGTATSTERWRPR